MRPRLSSAFPAMGMLLMLCLATGVVMDANAAPPPNPRQPSRQKQPVEKSWWSWQPLKVVEPPAPRDLPVAWGRNPIDHFIFARLEEKNLKPNPPADPRTLIRRMTYDVLGLPPTPEEVDAFVN